MNLLEMLSRELKDKHYDEFEKTRYVYNRCCQIFSFDARWNYFTLFSDELIKKIEERTFDVKKIDSPLVICHSYSRHILKTLLEELTRTKVEVVGTEHSYIRAHIGKKRWVLDATEGDFPRMKMGLKPMGFRAEDEDVPLDDVDKELGFSYVSKDIYRSIPMENPTIFMAKVANIISTSQCKYHYSDVAFLYNYMTYLMRQSTKTKLDSKGDLYRDIHFGENDKDYILSKENGEYGLKLVKKSN